jgi:uncharacterized protein YbjT (DUF2867 family)
MTIMRRVVLAVAAVLGVMAGPAWAQGKGAVLVLGGTGQLGAEVVKILAAKGEPVTVLARPDSKRDLLAGLKVDYAVGDLMNAAEVAAAVKAKPVRAIISTVRVEDGDVHFYEKMFTNLLPAAKAAGVTQFIHHSAVGAGDNAKNFTDQGWDSRPDMMKRLADQGTGEELLRRSGITFTIIRNSRIWPANTPATGKAVLTEDQTVISPMTRADLAQLTVSCLDNPACAGKVYHVKDDSLTWPPPRPAQ